MSPPVIVSPFSITYMYQAQFGFVAGFSKGRRSRPFAGRDPVRRTS